MSTFKSIYTWVAIADALLLLALGVLFATGLLEHIHDWAFPDPDAVIDFLNPSSMDWKQITVTALMFGCPGSLVILWLGYIMFIWDGKD